MKAILLTLSRTTEFIEKFVIVSSILLMMVNSTANAIGRYAFGKSLFFSEELNQFLIVSVTFFGFAYAVRKGRNIRMTALYDTFGKRTRKVVLTIISLTTSLLLLFLAYQALFYVLEIKGLNRLSPALQFPVWIIYSVIPIGLFMASLQYMIAFLMNLTRRGAWHSYEIEDSEAEAVGV